MHERGLGFKRDFYLAKRHYDQASQMSDEAYMPVTLALVKIAVLWTFDTISSQTWFRGFPSIPFYNLLDMKWVYDVTRGLIVNYWDVYLITLLCAVVGAIFTFNRQRQRNRNRRVVTSQQDDEDDVIEEDDVTSQSNAEEVGMTSQSAGDVMAKPETPQKTDQKVAE